MERLCAILASAFLLFGQCLMKSLAVTEKWEAGPAFYRNPNIELSSNDLGNDASKESITRFVNTCNYANYKVQECTAEATQTSASCTCIGKIGIGIEFGARGECSFYAEECALNGERWRLTNKILSRTQCSKSETNTTQCPVGCKFLMRRAFASDANVTTSVSPSPASDPSVSPSTSPPSPPPPNDDKRLNALEIVGIVVGIVTGIIGALGAFWACKRPVAH